MESNKTETLNLPTTAEASKAIDSAIQDPLLNETKDLSRTGQAIMKDVQEVLESAKTVLEEKNKGDELQKVIQHAAAATGQAKPSLQELIMSLVSPADAEKAREDAKNGVLSAVTLARLFVTSPDFRKLVVEGTDILNELFKKQKQKLEDALDAATSSGAGEEIKEELESGLEKAKDAAKQGLEGNLEGAKKGAEEVKQTAQSVLEKGKDAAQDVAEEVSNELGKEMPPGQGKSKAARRRRRQRNKKRYFSAYLLTEEQEKKLVDRISTWIENVRATPEYEKAFNSMFKSLNKLKSRAEKKLDEGKEKLENDKGVEEAKKHAEAAADNGRVLVERFLGGYSLDNLLSTFEDLSDEVQNNEDAQEYVEKLKEFFSRAWENPEFFKDSQAVKDEIKSLVNDGRELFIQNFNPYIKKINYEFRVLSDTSARDTTTQSFLDNIKKLGQDAFLDEDGKPTLKPELLQDFEKLLPSILDKLVVIPLGHQSISTDEFDLTLDDLVVHLPNMSNNHFRVSSTTEYENKEARTEFRIHLSGVQADARGFKFEYKSKGVFKAYESGKADMYVTGQGLSLDLVIQPIFSQILSSDSTPQSSFVVKDVDCSIEKLDLYLYETSRDWLYKLLMPFIRNAFRKRLETAIERTLKEGPVNLGQVVSEKVSEAGDKIKSVATDAVKLVNPQ